MINPINATPATVAAAQLERAQRKALKRLRRNGTLAELQLTPEDLLQILCLIKACADHKEKIPAGSRYYTKLNGGYVRLFDSDIDILLSKFTKLSDLIRRNDQLTKGVQNGRQPDYAG